MNNIGLTKAEVEECIAHFETKRAQADRDAKYYDTLDEHGSRRKGIAMAQERSYSDVVNYLESKLASKAKIKAGVGLDLGINDYIEEQNKLERQRELEKKKEVKV